MKICFTGPVLDFSGFAHAARGMLRSLLHQGADLVVRPLRYDKADAGNEYQAEDWLQPLLERPLEDIDCLIQCTTANVEAVPKPGILNGLYTFFEFDRLPVTWMQKINQFDFIIVPCVYNAQVLGRCGCNKPVLIMPTAVDTEIYSEEREPFPIERSEGRTVFYNICQLSAKKGLDLLLRSYFAAFIDRPDEVLLVLKTYIGMANREGERAKIKEFIDRVKQGCNIPTQKWPPVKVITQVCSDEDIQRLHEAGDAYVNPSRAEGFCIPAFEALAHGNTLISSATGGMAEYVNPKTALVVNAMMTNVYEMHGTDPNLANGIARWFEVSTAELSDVMRSFHLLRQGADAGELNEDNQKLWADIMARRHAGQQFTRKHDYRMTGPKLMDELTAAYTNWKNNGQVAFKSEPTNVPV